jgi:hypothetical protein
MTDHQPKVPDEHELAELQQYVDRAQRILDDLDREHPTAEVRDLPPSLQAEVASDKFDAWRGLDAARMKLAQARAAFDKEARERSDKATAAMVVANQEMANASRDAARASSDSARAAKIAAIWTAVAAIVAAAGTAITAWLGFRR